MRVAVLGAGRLGSRIANEIARGKAGDANLVAIYDRHPEKIGGLARRLHVKAARSFSELLNDGTIDVIIEAASAQAVREHGTAILDAGKNLIMLSSGALVEDSFREKLISAARRKNRRIYVPSGSIVGLDGIKGASTGGLKEVTVEYRRSPVELAKDLESLGKARLVSIKKPKKVFEGSAAKAVKMFPHRLNITASTSLVGIGPSRTKVRVVLDPKTKGTAIRLHAEGRGGHIFAESRIKGVKEAGTAYFAVASTVRMLKRLTETLQVGT